MTLDEIMRFNEWVIENNCEQVAVESTGVYWVPIHTVLENKIEDTYEKQRKSCK